MSKSQVYHESHTCLGALKKKELDQTWQECVFHYDKCERTIYQLIKTSFTTWTNIPRKSIDSLD